MSMDLAIKQLDTEYKLYIVNLFSANFQSFGHRFGHNLRTRLSTGMVYFILRIIQLII